MRFWQESPHASVDQTRQTIAKFISGPERAWTLTNPDAGEAIGLVYYLGNPGPPGMGYILHPRAWGKGLMTEAVQAALRFGFDTLGLDRVELWIDERNDRSFRLAERVGFARRAAFRQKYPHDKETHEKVVYGLHVAEWRGDRTRTVPEGKAYGLFPIVPVRDVRLTAEYYRDTLGFEIAFLYGAPPTYGAVTLSPWSASGATIHFSAEPSLTPYSLYVSVGPDIGRLEARYRERGVEILQHLARMPWGQLEFSIRDCDGHILKFGTPG